MGNGVKTPFGNLPLSKWAALPITVLLLFGLGSWIWTSFGKAAIDSLDGGDFVEVPAQDALVFREFQYHAGHDVERFEIDEGGTLLHWPIDHCTALVWETISGEVKDLIFHPSKVFEAAEIPEIEILAAGIASGSGPCSGRCYAPYEHPGQFQESKPQEERDTINDPDRFWVYRTYDLSKNGARCEQKQIWNQRTRKWEGEPIWVCCIH